MMSKNGCRSGWTCVATMMLTISGSRALQTPSFYSEANALETHRKLQTCGNCVWDEVITPPSADMSCVVCISGKQSETSASCLGVRSTTRDSSYVHAPTGARVFHGKGQHAESCTFILVVDRASKYCSTVRV